MTGVRDKYEIREREMYIGMAGKEVKSNSPSLIRIRQKIPSRDQLVNSYLTGLSE